MPNTTKITTKTCNACPYASKCPIKRCDTALFCPRESDKPVLEHLKAGKPHIYWQLMTCYDN